MSLLSEFIIFTNILLVILKQSNTSSPDKCEANFLDLIERCSNSKDTPVFYNLPINFKIETANETEYIEWVENFCPDAIKESQCLANVKFILPDMCHNLIFLNYLIVDKHHEETNMLCDNNAEGFKKLIPNEGLNLYFQDNLHFDACPNKIYSDITSLLSDTEVCRELKMNELCYNKTKSGDSINPNINDLRSELNQRLIVRFNCTGQQV